MNPIALLVVAAVALYGLATAHTVPTDGPDAQGYKWELTQAPLPATVHIVTDGMVQDDCGIEPGALSCAVRDEQAKTCDIYLDEKAAAWEDAHELRHCAGWVHPGGLSW